MVTQLVNQKAALISWR